MKLLKLGEPYTIGKNNIIDPIFMKLRVLCKN